MKYIAYLLVISSRLVYIYLYRYIKSISVFNIGDKTMRSASISLLLLILPVLVVAQPPDNLWSQLYGGQGNDYCYSACETSDGGYIFAGFTTSWGSGYRDLMMLKSNSDGDSMWCTIVGGWQGDECRSVQQITDGGFILGGVTATFGAGVDDFWALKTNVHGDTAWTRTYGGNEYEECWSVQETVDGGYILAGHTNSFGAGNYDFWLVKISSNGDSMWSQTFGGDANDECFSVQQTTDSGYILAGWTSDWSDPDFWLVKTDVNGNYIWDQTFGGGSYDKAFSCQQTQDEGYIIAGYTESFGSGQRDFWLVKTDNEGNCLWSKTYGGSGHDECWSCQQTSDGGYILGGITWSFGVGDYWIVRTDQIGDSLWSRTYGGSNVDQCTSVLETTDGGFMLAGWTFSFGAGAADFYLVKTGPEYPNIGYVTLVQPGPPDWGYRLHWVSGALSRIVFTNFCSGTVGSVSGVAATAGWTATNYADSIVFTTSTPLTSGAIDTFCLSHPWCSEVVDWTVGDSSGSVEGPLPVEMTTFQAVAGDEQVTLQWRTESELDNDHFVLYKRKAGEENFHPLTEISGYGTTAEPHDYQYIDSWVQNGITYDYQISDVDIAGRETFHEQIISATPGRDIVPTEFTLYQNYPNPFNPITTIRYDVKEAGLVSLKIFDLLGREVTTLIHEEHAVGVYSITWNAAGMPSGIYLARMEAEGFAQVRKLLLVK